MESSDFSALHPPSQPPPLLPPQGSTSRAESASKASKRMGFVRPKEEPREEPKPVAALVLLLGGASHPPNPATLPNTASFSALSSAGAAAVKTTGVKATGVKAVGVTNGSIKSTPKSSLTSILTTAPASTLPVYNQPASSAGGAHGGPPASESGPPKATFGLGLPASLRPNDPSLRMRSNTFHKELDSILDTRNNNVDVEYKSGAYFRRLSVPPESTFVASEFRLVDISRKILFAFSELHSSLRRFTGFCVDKKLTMRMVAMLYSTKTEVDLLVECLETVEEEHVDTASTQRIRRAVLLAIQAFRSVIGVLQTGIPAFVEATDACFIRMFILTVYGSYAEICNAYRLLNHNGAGRVSQPVAPAPVQPTAQTNDQRLYEALEHATSSAQTVFTQLTEAIGKSAIASATAPDAHQINTSAATKVRELTTASVAAMTITKKVAARLATIRDASGTEKRRVWEDINLFLKAVINILATSKSAFNDLPVLNDIRPSMAALTKATKDVTLALEVSSYKSEALNAPPLLSVPSVANMFSPIASQPPTLPPTGSAHGLSAMMAQSPGVFHYANPFDQYTHA